MHSYVHGQFYYFKCSTWYLKENITNIYLDSIFLPSTHDAVHNTHLAIFFPQEEFLDKSWAESKRAVLRLQYSSVGMNTLPYWLTLELPQPNTLATTWHWLLFQTLHKNINQAVSFVGSPIKYFAQKSVIQESMQLEYQIHHLAITESPRTSQTFKSISLGKQVSIQNRLVINS